MRGTILAGAVVALGILSSPSYAATITLTVTPSTLDPNVFSFGSISASSNLPASGTFTASGESDPFFVTTTAYVSQTIDLSLFGPGTGTLPTGVTLSLYKVGDSMPIEMQTSSGATGSISLSTLELAGGHYYDVLTGTSHSGTSNAVGISGGAAVFAVPELSTWGMLTLGFAGLGYAAFRRKAGNRTVAAI